MARPRKPDNEKAKSREIHVDDETWKNWKAAAAAGGISVAEYVRRCCNRPSSGSVETLQLLTSVQAIDAALGEVAVRLGDHTHACIPGLLFELIAIERHCAQLTKRRTRR